VLARLGGAVVLSGFLAVTQSAAAPPGEASGTVSVFAAASLVEAFRAAGEELRARHPRLTVQFNFAGSSALVHQIEQGAPADVFASADEASARRLADAGLFRGPPSIFAQNRLAIAVPSGNPKRIAGLADLARPGLVVALCAPAVPAGRGAAHLLGASARDSRPD
jgi:molybdate transport system substrate-binding protein